MKTYIEPSRSQWTALCQRPSDLNEVQDQIVDKILAEVKQEGDKALIKYSLQLDHCQLENFKVGPEALEAAEYALDPALKNAIHVARKNIEFFHQSQVQTIRIIETMPGVQCWQKSTPIERVGIYIPGGTAPLFSTVLMLAIPAKIAGCKEIILCSPPDKEKNIHPAILYAAKLCGVTQTFRLGGAQAIAALAYGTEQIPAVTKIFGPGNRFVTQAKMKVQQQGISIDLPAGPSEVMICADDQADPSFVAIDLLSQAEHGADSQVVLVCDSETMISRVEKEVNDLVGDLPRKKHAEGALKNSFAILLKNQQDQIDFINAYAPEHLILNHREADSLAERIINAGSVFIGPYTPESVGDYASGTNHTLPTSAYAKAYSGVNLDAFTKKITFQKLSKTGLRNIGPHVEIMAEAEALKAHQLAVSIRLEKLKTE